MERTESARTRTVTWDDPMPGVRAAGALPGLEYLKRIGRGELPPAPLMRVLDIRPVEVEEGRAVFAVEPSEFHYNPMGVVHGGLTSTLVDTAMGCAVHSLLPAGSAYTTLELKVNLIRPISRDTGEVICEGKALHVGSRIATAEARVFDRSGKLYAHATTTCMILS